MSDGAFRRREFLGQTVLGAGAVGVLALAPQPSSAQVPQVQSPQDKDPIRIGVRFGEAWLRSKNDDDLRFFKQIGVDWVDIELSLIQGFTVSTPTCGPILWAKP